MKNAVIECNITELDVVPHAITRLFVRIIVGAVLSLSRSHKKDRSICARAGHYHV